MILIFGRLAADNGDTRDIEAVSTCCFCHKTSIGRYKAKKHYNSERDECSNSDPDPTAGHSYLGTRCTLIRSAEVQ